LECCGHSKVLLDERRGGCAEGEGGGNAHSGWYSGGRISLRLSVALVSVTPATLKSKSDRRPHEGSSTSSVPTITMRTRNIPTIMLHTICITNDSAPASSIIPGT
jgi:hypothetical protein